MANRPVHSIVQVRNEFSLSGVLCAGGKKLALSTGIALRAWRQTTLDNRPRPAVLQLSKLPAGTFRFLGQWACACVSSRIWVNCNNLTRPHPKWWGPCWTGGCLAPQTTHKRVDIGPSNYGVLPFCLRVGEVLLVHLFGGWFKGKPTNRKLPVVVVFLWGGGFPE